MSFTLSCLVFLQLIRYSHCVPASFLRLVEIRSSAHTESVRKRRAGQWLFGSLTCSSDILPIDKMWPHQLHQSASRNFNHRVLYVCSAGSPDDQRQHHKMLETLKSQNLVDQVENVEDVAFDHLALRLMDEATARAFVNLDFAKDYNKAMVAFLIKCIDMGYDHCAWLDPDIFVHRGQTPWVDEAVQMSEKKHDLVYTRPRTGDDGGFSSRYFVYHREALEHLLPFTSNAPKDPLDTFETLFNDNMMQRFGGNDEDEFAGVGRGDSWVIHPPDEKSHVRSILQSCANEERSLNALIAIVEKGSEDGEDAFRWRDTKSNGANMDSGGWEAHVAHRCDSHEFWRRLFTK